MWSSCKAGAENEKKELTILNILLLLKTFQLKLKDGSIFFFIPILI